MFFYQLVSLYHKFASCSIDVSNEQVWCLLVTQVTIHADGSAEFLFRGENHITVK